MPEYVPITDMIGVGSPAGVRKGRRERSLASPRCRTPSLRANDRSTVGGSAPKMSQNDQGRRGSATREAQWLIGPWTTGRRIAAPSPLDAAGQLVNVAGKWTRKTAGSSRVSGAVALVSKRRLGTRQGMRLPPAPGYWRPQARRRTWPNNRPTLRAAAH